MSAENHPDPYLSFRFHVEIDSLTVGGFSSVSGLEHQMDPEEYEEGGNNRFTHRLPTRYTQPNVVLERGMTDSRALWEWLENAREGSIERRTVRIALQNTTGAETWLWELTGAYPVRWAAPEFQADQGAVAIETLELAHQGFTSTG